MATFAPKGLPHAELARIGKTFSDDLTALRAAVEERHGAERAAMLFGAACDAVHRLFAAAGAEDYYRREGGR